MTKEEMQALLDSMPTNGKIFIECGWDATTDYRGVVEHEDPDEDERSPVRKGDLVLYVNY